MEHFTLILSNWHSQFSAFDIDYLTVLRSFVRSGFVEHKFPFDFNRNCSERLIFAFTPSFNWLFPLHIKWLSSQFKCFLFLGAIHFHSSHRSHCTDTTNKFVLFARMIYIDERKWNYAHNSRQKNKKRILLYLSVWIRSTAFGYWILELVNTEH